MELVPFSVAILMNQFGVVSSMRTMKVNMYKSDPI